MSSTAQGSPNEIGFTASSASNSLANNRHIHLVLNDQINANVHVQTSFFLGLSSTFDILLSSALKILVLQAIPTRHSAEQMFGSRALCASPSESLASFLAAAPRPHIPALRPTGHNRELNGEEQESGRQAQESAIERHTAICPPADLSALAPANKPLQTCVAERIRL